MANALVDAKQKGEILKSKFRKFKESLPPNLSNTPNRDYDLRYLWKQSNKPKDFAEFQGIPSGSTWKSQLPIDVDSYKKGNYTPPDKGFGLVEDINPDGTTSYNYHGNSVEANTGRFLKPKNHPSLYKELEWYNSNEPDAMKFRSENKLVKSGKYYKYVPIKKIK